MRVKSNLWRVWAYKCATCHKFKCWTWSERDGGTGGKREREREISEFSKVLTILFGAFVDSYAVHPTRILEREQQFILTEIPEGPVANHIFAIEFLSIYLKISSFIFATYFVFFYFF